MTHVFISYCRDNSPTVTRLNEDLRKRGIRTWIDVKDIGAGVNWQIAIRKAIKDGAAFVACFSRELAERSQAYAHREVRLAIEQLQTYPSDRAWFIPVRLNDCEIPDMSIGGNDVLSDLNYVDLSRDWDVGVERIFLAIKDHCDLSEEDLGKGASKEAMKRIWAVLYPLKCAGDDLLEEVSEDNLAAFTSEFQKLKEVLGNESLNLSEEEYERLDEIVKYFGTFRLGKKRLRDLKRDETAESWELQEMKRQVNANVATHKKFCARLRALRGLYDTGKHRLAA